MHPSAILLSVLLFATVLLARGPGSAVLQEALDRPVDKIELKNSVVADALQTIWKQTGVRVEPSAEVFDLLPWGDQTTINARIEHVTLRQALDAVSRRLGLVVAIRDDVVELRPMPALQRLGRRSTLDELAALALLEATPAALPSERLTVRKLIELLDARLATLDEEASKAGQQPPGLAIEFRPGDAVGSEQFVYVPRNATLMGALESIANDTRATWYPWGKSILVVAKSDHIRSQLSRPLNVRYPGTDVGQVLLELGMRCGVDFEIEPGALQRIDPEFRRVRLDLADAPVTRALDAIAGFTGLAWTVNERGVYLWYAASPVSADPVVALVPLKNGVLLTLTSSQLPPDLQDFLNHRREQALEELRGIMRREGFEPSTRPATQPPPDAPG
jgi:hypothetical protein